MKQRNVETTRRAIARTTMYCTGFFRYFECKNGSALSMFYKKRFIRNLGFWGDLLRNDA